MIKLFVTGLASVLACAALACSGQAGPTESDPNGSTASTSSNVSDARYYYTCNGGDTRPCSDSEYVEIISSASYNPKTGGFVNKFHQACTTAQCGEGTSTPICPSEY